MRASQERGRQGSMLVLALWVLCMLSVFAVSLGFGVRQRAALLDRLTTLDALYPIAYSGVEKAKSLVKADFDTAVDSMTDSWAAPPDPQGRMANGDFFLGSAEDPGLTDEESKINLNSTAPDILSRLFQSAGLSRENAEEIAYCVIDWMDPDSFFGHPQHGAEASYYENLRLPYTASNKPYKALDELLLVKGMTPEIFEKVRPFVTVYGTGKVNMNTAPPEVLAALGLSPEGAAAIARYRAGGDGKEGTADDNIFTNAASVATDMAAKSDTPLDGVQATILQALVDTSRVDVISTAFGVHSRATLAGKDASAEVEAVIDRKGSVLYCRASEPKL